MATGECESCEIVMCGLDKGGCDDMILGVFCFVLFCFCVTFVNVIDCMVCDDEWRMMNDERWMCNG